MKYYISIVFILFGLDNILAQTNEEIFSFKDFQEIIIKNHPVIKQSNLYLNAAQAEYLQAQGLFDPKLSVIFDRKAFQGKDYYNRFETVLKVPLYSGIELKSGYERNAGLRLLGEESPSLLFGGITLPIGQGLLIDARRNTLLQARLLDEIAEAERRKVVNKFIFSAAKDYWEWYISYKKLQLAQEAFRLADTRFKLLSERSSIGELAAIDSVGANITLQERELAQKQAQLEFKNTGLILSNYLWNEEEKPLELPENLVPQSSISELIDRKKIDDIQANLLQTHPELSKITFKQQQLTIEEKFRKELLKPQLNFNFNLINSPISSQKDAFANTFLLNNHKFGFDFMMPVLLRKERGKLQSVRIKQKELNFEKITVQRELNTNIETIFNEINNLGQQIQQQLSINLNQERLLEAEKNKFSMGESTIFMLNTRENKLIEMKLKLETLKAKYEKAKANLFYTAAVLN